MSKRLFKTMVALLAIAAAAGPARAQNGNLLTTITATSLTTYDETTPGVVNVILDGQLAYNNDDGWQAMYGDGKQGSVTVTAKPGFSIDSCKFYVYFLSSYQDSYTVTAAPFAVYPYCETSSQKVYPQPNAQGNGFGYYGGVKRIEVYGTVQLYTVRMAAGTEEAANWSIASGNASVTGTQVLENVMSGSQVTATYNGTTKKVKSVKAVKYVPPVLVSSIVLDKQTANLAKDSTMTLSVASVLPENAADKSYTWSSDNTSVATVNQNGVVTGMAAGTANIIATANDGSGVKDTCVVTVLRSAILDGVRVLYATYDNEPWSTVIGYNPGVLYQDDDDNVRLTSNGAFLYHDGTPVYVIENFYTGSNGYQWLLVTEIDGSKFYYRQGETWQQAIDADRMYNEMWSIENGQVRLLMQTLVDSNYNPVDPAATIDPSTVNYHLWSLDN